MISIIEQNDVSRVSNLSYKLTVSAKIVIVIHFVID